MASSFTCGVEERRRGIAVGAAAGVTVGVAVGAAVGVAVGMAVGAAVGVAVGRAVGVTVGAVVGAAVGVAVGTAVGVAVGAGTGVGDAVGAAVAAGRSSAVDDESGVPPPHAASHTPTSAARQIAGAIRPTAVRNPGVTMVITNRMSLGKAMQTR